MFHCAEGDRVSLDTNPVPDGANRVSVDIHPGSNDLHRMPVSTTNNCKAIRKNILFAVIKILKLCLKYKDR